MSLNTGSFKVLSLDGGGVFGRIQSHIVSAANCLDKFDAFVGTSIGSALAMSYALGKDVEINPEYFDKWMPKVFNPSFFRTWNPFVPKHRDVQLNLSLRDAFGSLTIGNAKKPVFITAASIDQKALKVFSSTNFDDTSLLAWEVVRCSVAAPTFFKQWNGMADGGVYANNPAMIGVAAAARVLKVPLQDIEVFSLGTGISATCKAREPYSRASWGFWLIDAMLSGASDKMHDYFVKSLPIKRYERYQFVREPSWRMDSPRCMYLAEQAWAVDISRTIQALKDF